MLSIAHFIRLQRNFLKGGRMEQRINTFTDREKDAV
jgi:hypothetical protein